MGYEPLKSMAETYPPQEKEALLGLAGEYNRRSEREILEVAAIAADVSLDNILNLGLEPDANPALSEALTTLGYSNDTFTSFENIEGHISRIKGTYFEILVRDRLNDGESIGDIELLAGQKAELAKSLTQPGWDLAITDRSGAIVEQVQLKATEDWSYVKQALEKYPDIRVIVPEELEGKAAGLDEVLSTGITDEALEDTVSEQLKELSEDQITDILHQSAESGFDAIPIFSAALIGITETGHVLMGRSTVVID